MTLENKQFIQEFIDRKYSGPLKEVVYIQNSFFFVVIDVTGGEGLWQKLPHVCHSHQLKKRRIDLEWYQNFSRVQMALQVSLIKSLNFVLILINFRYNNHTLCFK